MTPAASCRSARVIANFGRRIAVQPDAASEPLAAYPLSRLPLLVAGDRVHIEPVDGVALDGTAEAMWRVVALEPRASVLARRDRRGQPRPLAANLTHLAIVSAPRPGIDRLLVDQFCVVALAAGVEPLVVVNKADLLCEASRADIEHWLSVYRSVGFETAIIDTVSPDGTAVLRKRLDGRASVLVGASGVGKSSIVDRLLPDREVRIGALSDATGFGSHTTTVTCWYALDGHAALVDSPGVRRFSPVSVDRRAVERGFPEIARAAQACRFANCAHLREPGCAVRAALASSEIAAWRYAHYAKLLSEAAIS